MKLSKRYYICRNYKSWNFDDIDMICGPYSSIDDAKKIMDKIAAEGVLNDSRYEDSFRINIYRESIVDLIPDKIYSEEEFLKHCNDI